MAPEDYTEQDLNPSIGDTHVTLPISLYLAMSECYFGRGRRFREPLTPATTPTSEGTVEDGESGASVDESIEVPENGDVLDSHSEFRGDEMADDQTVWVPRGYAARAHRGAPAEETDE